MTAELKFYSGTSGIVLPVANKSFFPPEFKEKSRLNFYASLFNSVEVNSSFYKVPLAATVQKWANDVPEQFRFTFKLWREISHKKELRYEYADLERFIKVVKCAGDQFGCLLVQFPPGLTASAFILFERLLADIRNLAPAGRFPVAVEFRHRSWYTDDVYLLLEKYSVAMVLQDMPASATPFVDAGTKLVYLRFHGPEGGYRGSYDESFLYEYAGYIKDWLAEGKTVYAYFNNTAGDAIANLKVLNGLVLSR